MTPPSRIISVLIWTGVLCCFIPGGMNAADRYVNTIGVQMPPDAARPEDQVLRLFLREGRSMEHFGSIYQGMQAMWMVAEPLIRRDKDFQLLPAGAESWSASDDGLVWTFHIQPGLQFSDGRPLNAHDYVYSFRRGADPRNAYDGEFYFPGIKHWQDVVGRRRPIEDLGVYASDEQTLKITTDTPMPHLPQLLTFSHVTPRQAVEKYGDTWSTRAETYISSGPFLLHAWAKRDQLTLKANPTYQGPAKPYLEQVVYKLFIPAAPPPYLAAYQADEVDYIPVAHQAELSRIQTDPLLQQELHSFPEFTTFYLLMNTLEPPFDNLKLRQALSHAIDRTALVSSALRDVAEPAWSMLPPGFPGADPEQLRDIQRYDPVLARQLLAEAGYPEGMGLPPLELWLRDEGPVQKTAAEAIQAMLKRSLGISVLVRNLERKTFMDALNSHRLTFGMTSYVYDFYDPISLLGIWRSNGRHAWRHDPFDRLIVEAGRTVADPLRRLDLYRQAEHNLVSDVGGVFLWHPKTNTLWKSYVRGEALEPNRFGYRAWRNDGLMRLTSTLYITNERYALSESAGGFWDW